MTQSETAQKTLLARAVEVGLDIDYSPTLDIYYIRIKGDNRIPNPLTVASNFENVQFFIEGFRTARNFTRDVLNELEGSDRGG